MDSENYRYQIAELEHKIYQLQSRIEDLEKQIQFLNPGHVIYYPDTKQWPYRREDWTIT